MRGLCGFRDLALERSIPLPGFNQCVGVQAPVRNLFVAIGVRGWIQEIRLGHQKPVDKCIDGFYGQDRDINGGVQANTVMVVMMQGPFLEHLNLAAVRNFLVLRLAPLQPRNILELGIPAGFATDAYIVYCLWIFHRAVKQGELPFRGQIVRQLPCPIPGQLFVFTNGCLQYQVVRNGWLGSEKVGINSAVLTVNVVVRCEFPAQDRRSPFYAIQNAHVRAFPVSA